MAHTALPKEHILRLDINAQREITLICTDAALEELTVGYLYNEGILSTLENLECLTFSEDRTRAQVRLRTAQNLSGSEVRVSGFGSPQLKVACTHNVQPVEKRYPLSYIKECAAELQMQAAMYRETGGMHCSALFDGGECICLFEDVGRHNTLDKLCGALLKCGRNAKDCLLITTGRVSSDMVRKAGMMGVSCIVSMSTPTDKAYEWAAGNNMTLVGYIQRGEPVVYCGTQRLEAYPPVRPDAGD